MTTHKPEGIAIIGMAGRFPGADNIDHFWNNLVAGKETIATFSDQELRESGLEVEQLRKKPGFVGARGVLDKVDLFDASFFGINAKEAEVIDPQQRVFLEAAWEALENAGCDPETFPGAIGVFAGMGGESYYLNNLHHRQDVIDLVGDRVISLGNARDFMATRVAYKLNLRGPALNISTACSTGLVVVCQACQQLLNYQCDIALAGSVSISFPQRRGVYYQENGIFSGDGHCRPFDQQAQGTVSSEGLGIVVLKRLADALRDKDQIFAVIKGHGLNNDGADKVGFTAPSVDGQAEVIAMAHADAGIDPGTISYIECHGTATPIGDPIEIAALTQAFRLHTNRKHFCAIGSVKGNIGHTDTAAGVAGLIKSALALKHKLLPPSLHFTTPNPKIDFANSPFFVNSTAREWDNAPFPRRAGVSAFGLGGTNAHVVLEEAPPYEPSSPSRDWQLLVLSAKSHKALEAAAANLAAHFKQHPELSLADAAFTLQSGRQGFAHRRIIVSKDLQDAIHSIERNDSKRVFTGEAPADRSPVIFMFSGQGAQQVNMGANLYRSEKTFKEEVDRCSEILLPILGRDIRDILYPEREKAGEAEELMKQTGMAQPVLFSVEYALAQLWMSWGIKPAALIGHSIGEYVAACLAGVFSLADALALVAKRGQLMQSMPPGRMLAVSMAADELAKLLPPNLSLAAANGPFQCVVSGPTDEVEAFAAVLESAKKACTRLHTSHAFHSSMMDPILDRFAKEAGLVRREQPKIPFISNVTGTWISAAEATNPHYWARHIRQPVRFGDGLKELFKGRNPVLLEVGPGTTLTALAKAQSNPSDTVTAISSLKHAREEQADTMSMLAALGQLWLRGVKVDWRSFQSQETRHRVSLPTYPFQREKYWIEPSPKGKVPQTSPQWETAPRVEEAGVSGHERPELNVAFAAPGSETEQRLATLWQQLLGYQKIGVNDSFFDLGGDSLRAMKAVFMIQEAFGVQISLKVFIETPTIAALARHLNPDEARQEDNGHSAPRRMFEPEMSTMFKARPGERYEPFPLTDIQQAYLIGRGNHFDMGNNSAHGYTEMEIAGLDTVRYQQTWQKLIERHEMLRAIIRADGLQQIKKDPAQFEIRVEDLSGLDTESAQKILTAAREEMSHQVLPHDRSPLIDIRIFKMTGDTYRLHMSRDALMADAWSWSILRKELIKLYNNPDACLPPLEASFRDYVLALGQFANTDSYRKSLDYWDKRFATFPTSPQLPLAKGPEAVKQPRFQPRQAIIQAEAWRSLKEKIAAFGLTENAMMIAVYADILATWCKRPHFIINLALFNRLPIHPQVDQLIGDFTSTTLLEVSLNPADNFLEFTKKLMGQLWQDLDHRVVSGVQVTRRLARQQQDRTSAVAPIVFTSTLGFGGQDPKVSLTGKENLLYRAYQTPQVWIDNVLLEDEGNLILTWQVVDELFPRGMIDDMFEAYAGQIRRLATEESAWSDTRFAREQKMMPAWQRLERNAVNATAKPISGELLHLLFEKQALRNPGGIAVIGEENRLTYSDLMHLSRRLGKQLREMGARTNSLIAIVMEKGVEQVIAALSILQAGAAYVPIDASLPQERLFQLLANAEAQIALTQGCLDEALQWPAHIKRICVRVPEGEIPPAEALEALQSPTDLAYVIYTSGSTGQPKGVVIDHRGAVNTILDVNERFKVGPHDRVLALSSMSFDLSVYDVFGMLAAGGTIVIPEAWAGRDPARWAELANREGVTVWNSVPALMEMFAEYVAGRGNPLPPSLRLVMLSGDWIPLTLPGQIRDRSRDVVLISMGGATEASIWSILYPIGDIDPTWKSIPYGRPMVNQTFQVLNDLLEPCPTWVPGQLYIGGIGLAKGYWRDEEKTKAKFITHPQTGERLYHTGDLGRYLPGGDIEFLGREDFQVKIRGFRIELGEIEAALSQHPRIRSVVVNAAGKTTAERHLVAYVVLNREEATRDIQPTQNGWETELKEFLAEKLPEHMIPAAIVVMEALPLTANGKVDYRSLPEPNSVEIAGRDSRLAPRNEVETALAGIWQEVLQVAAVGIHDDFFELGGDSISAIQMVSRANKKGYQLTPMQVFRHPTIAVLAEKVSLQAQASSDNLPTSQTNTGELAGVASEAFDEGKL